MIGLAFSFSTLRFLFFDSEWRVCSSRASGRPIARTCAAWEEMQTQLNGGPTARPLTTAKAIVFNPPPGDMHDALTLLFRVGGIADLHVFVDAVTPHAFVRRSPPPPYDVAVGRASSTRPTATCSYARGMVPLMPSPLPACIPPANFVRPGRVWFDDSSSGSDSDDESEEMALWYATVNHACVSFLKSPFFVMFTGDTYNARACVFVRRRRRVALLRSLSRRRRRHIPP